MYICATGGAILNAAIQTHLSVNNTCVQDAFNDGVETAYGGVVDNYVPGIVKPILPSVDLFKVKNGDEVDGDCEANLRRNAAISVVVALIMVTPLVIQVFKYPMVQKACNSLGQFICKSYKCLSVACRAGYKSCNEEEETAEESQEPEKAECSVSNRIDYNTVNRSNENSKKEGHISIGVNPVIHVSPVFNLNTSEGKKIHDL